MSPFDDELTPDPAETWWDYFQENRDLPMAPQVRNWTCSICATDWTLRATGLNPYSTREQVTAEIGYPNCVDEYSGLRDGACVVRVFADYGVDAVQEWVSDFDRAYQLCSETAGLVDSIGMYHFMAIRGVTDNHLWVANSALGYRGVYETISRDQFLNLGPWKLVWLVR